MAKRRYFKRHSKGKMKIPLLVTIPVLAPLFISLNERKGYFPNDPIGGVREILFDQSIRFTGFNPRDSKMYWNYPINTWTGIVLGYLGHKIMNKIGVNRMLSKVPYVSM